MSSVGKKLINHAEYCVDDSLDGLVMVNPGIRKLAGHRVVVRADIKRVKEAGKVTVVCGGGSGHEPGHAGTTSPCTTSLPVAGLLYVCYDLLLNHPFNMFKAVILFLSHINLVNLYLLVMRTCAHKTTLIYFC